MQKFFLTKYALSQREIDEVTGELSEAGYVHVKSRYTSFKLGRDIFKTRGDAVEHVMGVMLPAKIASVEKQLGKLRKFELK